MDRIVYNIVDNWQVGRSVSRCRVFPFKRQRSLLLAWLIYTWTNVGGLQLLRKRICVQQANDLLLLDPWVAGYTIHFWSNFRFFSRLFIPTYPNYSNYHSQKPKLSHPTGKRSSKSTKMADSFHMKPLKERNLSRLLMGPGPCNPPASVREAAALPLLGHLDPTFSEIMDELQIGLR